MPHPDEDNVFIIDLQDDRFVHFTPTSRVDEILKSGKLLMRPPYEKFGIDAVNAVSLRYGTFVPGVQTSHIKGDDTLSAIIFNTTAIPKYGYVEEVVWKTDVPLLNPVIVSAQEAIGLLQNNSEKLEDDAMVIYKKGGKTF